MILKNPFKISARLLPSLEIDGTFISLERAGRENGRDKFRYFLDLADGQEFSSDDLASGMGGCSIQSAFESLLSFLGAFAESFPDGENAGLFPAGLGEWAQNNSDGVSCLKCEIEETPGLVQE